MKSLFPVGLSSESSLASVPSPELAAFSRVPLCLPERFRSKAWDLVLRSSCVCSLVHKDSRGIFPLAWRLAPVPGEVRLASSSPTGRLVTGIV